MTVFIEPVKEYGSREIDPVVVAIQGHNWYKVNICKCDSLRKIQTPTPFTADLHFYVITATKIKAAITILFIKMSTKTGLPLKQSFYLSP